jgi:type IV pilus assembly protein PilB
MATFSTSPPDEPPVTRRRIGEVLVEQGLLSPQQLQEALDAQRDLGGEHTRRRLGMVVVDLGLANEVEVAEALALALGLRLVDLRQLEVVPEQGRLLPRAVALLNDLLILDRDGPRLVLATSDPTNVIALDDVKIYTRTTELEVLVATATQIREQLVRAWSLSDDSSDLGTMIEGLEHEDASESEEVVSAPVVRLVDVILADAVRARASDVHIEPQAAELRVRYRVDGLLRDVMTVPSAAIPSVVSRIKIVSGLDIAERRRPQDGRAKLTVDGLTVEARISTLPTLHGEKVVLRLLPPADRVPQLARAGMSPPQLDAVSAALTQTQGLVLITGPTGSGKTSTLYAALHQLSTPDRNIVTLEDPIEVQIAGITQVQVHERAGMTFARGLRSVLRQDPDIVLVGEVRDGETADLALRASLTGHLVLTTLHTNDAVSAVTRLVEMGAEPFLVASSLTLVVAQRLLRRVCASCAAPYTPSARTLSLLGLTEEDLEGATPSRGAGCVECGGTGYLGRSGVFEVLPVTAALRKVLLSTPTEAAIGAAAREYGMTTLRSGALVAAHDGETTYEEVLRSTHLDAVSVPRCRSCARALADDMVCCPWDGVLVAHDRCPTCERSVEPEWAHCPWCRTDLPRVEPVPAPSRVGLPRLLVVDDDESVRRFVELALAGSVEVTTAPDGATAMQLLDRQGFDGALIDHHLPDVSGIELIRLMRSDPRTFALPLMLFTGNTSEEVEREALHAGAGDFLTKPLEPELLEERILALLTGELSSGARARP